MNGKRSISQALWDQIPAAVQAYIEILEARVEALEWMVKRLEATVQHLTEHVQQAFRHSLRPPLERSPQAPGTRSRREPSGRRPGGTTRS